MKESIIAKVVKLFALADKNPNQHEAEQAMLKASKLMKEYSISEEALKSTKEVKCIEVKSKKVVSKFEALLAKHIAESMQCKMILGYNEKGKMCPCFFGKQLYAESAMECFERVLKVMRKGARLECEKYGLYNGAAGSSIIKNGYYYGFIEGMKAKLNEQCKALQIVVPVVVQEQYKEHYTKVEYYNQRSVKYSKSAYDNGYADGVRTNNANKLN